MTSSWMNPESKNVMRVAVCLFTFREDIEL